jgi:hypothetical protein
VARDHRGDHGGAHRVVDHDEHVDPPDAGAAEGGEGGLVADA